MNNLDKPVRFLMVADIHNSKTDGLDPTGCDAAIVAGDFKLHGWSSCHDEWRDSVNDDHFFNWCNAHQDLPVFLVPGNHDRVVERHPEWLVWPKNVIRLDTCDDAIEFKGLKIFGTPWTPIYRKPGAFNVHENELPGKYAAIPEHLDILVAHATPLLEDAEGDADVLPGHGHVGSGALRDAILSKKPRVVVCGHLHAEGHAAAKIGDTQIVNASRMLERDYDTPAFSPAYLTFNTSGTIDVTPAKKLR